jgi:shikimate kinase
MDFKNEIMRRVESLPAEQQGQLLRYIEGVEHQCINGETGRALLLSLTGALDDASAAEMTQAIESACEGVDPSEW